MPHGVSNTLDHMHVVVLYYIGTGTLYQSIIIYTNKNWWILAMASHVRFLITSSLCEFLASVRDQSHVSIREGFLST